jgi:hypothetical protein
MEKKKKKTKVGQNPSRFGPAGPTTGPTAASPLPPTPSLSLRVGPPGPTVIFLVPGACPRPRPSAATVALSRPALAARPAPPAKPPPDPSSPYAVTDGHFPSFPLPISSPLCRPPLMALMATDAPFTPSSASLPLPLPPYKSQ